MQWSDRWTQFAKYTFGVYLVHPLVIDLFDVTIFTTGLADHMAPSLIVISRFAVALPMSFALTIGLSKLKPLAWTIGLGPTPWDIARFKQASV